MEWYLVKKCLWIPYLMLLLRIHRCLGCLEEERVALLEINKVFLERSVAKDGSRVYTKGNDCCGWERVKCNATTGRVIQLSLDGFMELEMGNENENGSYLNVTLFSAFQELQHLNLSYRLFDGWIKNEGFEKLAGLRKLEVLDLSYNHFNNRIFASLATLKSIKILSLFENNLEGSSHFEELFTLIKLQSLDLSNNSLNASSRQFQDLCQLKHLQELDLSWNNFEGILPPCLQNLTTLKVLDLSHNRFKGNIHSSLISSLTSLVSISLSYNDFDGLFSFSSFANNCNLESIDLSSAGNKLKVETEYPSWVPPFQLKDLLLSNNNLNATIPRFLTTQHNLTFIDLSSNNLTGMFPTWLLENNKMLEVLILRNNSLGGHFVPSDIHRATNIMDISNNGFNGLLQENFGKMLPNLIFLNLSQNYFKGHIVSSIGNMKDLSVLDLSNNNFSGEIPIQMAIGCNNLVALILSNNSLHGQILLPYVNWTRLITLHLDHNLFSGNILSGLSKCSRLQILNIRNNQITGRLPNWIGNFTQIRTLIMGYNFFQGIIPVEFCILKNINFLELAHNLLSGSIPSILNSTSLQYLHLKGNKFTRISPAAFNDSKLLTLDMRANELYGALPKWIGVLSNLRILLLKQNLFSGPIPNSFCQLARTNIMDLSVNALSGSIPQCLNNISFGRIGGAGHESYFEGEFHLLPDIDFDFDGDLQISNYYDPNIGESEEVEFIMRCRSNSYKGNVLNFVSALDLSSNNLTNEIPPEIGDLNGIVALNLSHNQLSGPIPRTLSNLTQIESLDLSYCRLSGEIPSELSILYFLEVFTVAHNNLSGKTPEMKAQFSTFNSTSYEGNPFLCGPPLSRLCSSHTESINTLATTSTGVNVDDDIDMTAFFASFGASYVVFLLGFAAILYVNPYWRRMWFHFIEHCIHSCHEFLSNTWY